MSSMHASCDDHDHDHDIIQEDLQRSCSSLDSGSSAVEECSQLSTGLHVGNQLQAPRDSHQQRVNVYVRVKPSLDTEILDTRTCITVGRKNGYNGQETLVLRKQSRHGEDHCDKEYVFDGVLGQISSQAEVYHAVAQPIVDDVVNGYNGTILAYGQTGAGKTHTLSSIKPECIGIIPRAAQDIFQKISSDSDEVRLSYLQIYCEQIQDLLKPEMGDNLSIREGKQGHVYVPQLSEMVVSCLDDCLRLIQLGDRNRNVAFTELNAHSSRSHAVVIFTVVRKQMDPFGNDNMTTGKLFLVDLAGSERLKKSKSVAQRAVEARAINLSLTSLGKCVSARALGSQHVPFRDSKLTRLLQESLGGNAKTSMIIAIRGDDGHAEETYQSLEFGSRAMRVTTHAEVNVTVTSNEHVDQISKASDALLNSSLGDSAFSELKKDQERSQKVIECLEKEKLQMMEEKKMLQDAHEKRLLVEQCEKMEYQNQALKAEEKAREVELTMTNKVDELRKHLDRVLEQLEVMETNHDQEKILLQRNIETLKASESAAQARCDAMQHLLSEKDAHEAILHGNMQDVVARLDSEIREKEILINEMNALKEEVKDEKAANTDNVLVIAELRSTLESTKVQYDALHALFSSKESEHGQSLKSMEESMRLTYEQEIALCSKQITVLKSTLDRSKADLSKTQEAFKQIQEDSKQIQDENMKLKQELVDAKREASRSKRQAKEAIFKFDILSKHQRQVAHQNRAATIIQRAFRKHRMRLLRDERNLEYEELARTRHELGNLAARHAEMAAKRSSNLTFTGQTLLCEGLEVLQDAVEGILTTFVLPSKDLKALQRYKSKMQKKNTSTSQGFQIQAKH